MKLIKSQLTRLPLTFLLVVALWLPWGSHLWLRAEDKPAPTIESLTADVKRLTAELKSANEAHEAFVDQANKTRQADIAACWTDDLSVVQSRYSAAVAQKKAAALAKPEPKP